MSTRARAERLRRVFQLSDRDLADNRAGRLSPEQAKRARKATGDDATFMSGFAILFGVVMYGVLWFIWDSGAFSRMSDGPMGAALVIAVAGGLPTATIGWAIWTLVVHYRSRDLTVVATVEGTPEVTTRRYRQAQLHEVSVGDETFTVTPQAQAALAEYERVRLYYVPVSRVVVGAEPLDV